MLGLYFDTLIIGHTFCNMLRLLNKLRLQKELQNVVTKTTKTATKLKYKHKKTCQSRESNPGSLALQVDAFL